MRDEYYKEERMGRKTWVFILQLIIIWVILLPAQNLNEIFITANQAYRSQEYKRAIELYQQILSQGYDNKSCLKVMRAPKFITISETVTIVLIRSARLFCTMKKR